MSAVHTGVELFPANPGIAEILLDASDSRNYFKPYANGTIVWWRPIRSDGKGVREHNEVWDCLKVLMRVVYGFTYKQLELAKLTKEQRISLLEKWVRIGRVVSFKPEDIYE